MGYFKYQEAPTDGLPPGATTVMIRGVVRSISLEEFIRLLRTITKNYDLVYVPVGNKHSTNLGLAFVNYVDEEAARIGFNALCQARGPQKFRLVKSAYVQGFRPNLAFILASGNDAEASSQHHDHVMAIFRNGQRIKDVDALMQENVTQDLLWEAKELVARIDSEHRKDSTESEGSGNMSRSSGSRGHTRSSRSAPRRSHSMPRSRGGSYRSQGSGHHSSQGSHRMETHRHHHPPGGWFDEDYAPCSTYTGHPNMYPLPMQSASPAQAFLPPESPYQYQQAHAHQQFHMQQAQMQQAQMQQAAQLQQLQMRQSQAHRSIQMHIEGRPEQSQTQHFEEPYQESQLSAPLEPLIPIPFQTQRIVFEL